MIPINNRIMIPKNDHLLICPIKEGLISAEGNEYSILGTADGETEYGINDLIIAEYQFIIRVIVAGGKEALFVKKENVLACLK